MEDQIISIETAKLAKEKGFPIIEKGFYIEGVFTNRGFSKDFHRWYKDDPLIQSAPTQSLLQKFIRETRGVHIEIHRNASGYYWSMCKADGGTDLGWSDMSGPNDGGVWDSFEDALENALQVQLSYDLPNDITIIKHWGNYVEFALRKM